MVDDLNNLERDVELDLARWAGRLDVAPRDELMPSVRAMARVELDAAWMAAQPSPLPNPAALRRVRTAVAAELAGTGSRRGLLLRWVSSQGMGSMGAAAMLVLCIGVIWYAGTLASSVGSCDVETLLAAMTDSSTDSILDEVRSATDDLNDDAAVSVDDDDDESLGDLVREMDQLLDERGPAKGTSQLGVKPRGALG
jgi:hypothetical protein